jgi:hypothetical protein
VKTSCYLKAALIVGISLVVTAAMAGPPNAYDTLAKLLTPFVSVLAKNPKSTSRAVRMTVELENASSAPKEAVGSKVEISFQSPDKLRIRGVALGEDVTVCRNGQELWASPGDKIQALLDATAADRKLPPPDPKYKLAPFQLPVPEKQLVFLPALFRAQNAGQEEINGEVCQVLDLQLMPELARSAKEVQGWSARAWVLPDAKPARIILQGPDQTIGLRFSNVTFQKSLDPATWEAPADAAKIPPSRYDQLIRALLNRK